MINLSTTDVIAQKLATVVPNERITLYRLWPQEWQTRLRSASVGDTQPVMVSPETTAELSAVMTLAHQARWQLLIAGHGTKLSWGAPAQKIDLLVSTSCLNRLIDHAVGDMTVTAEAGMTFAALQKCLAQHNQWIPLDPGYAAQATLGGILATRDAGALRHRYGGVRDLCLGLSFVRSDGQVAKAGGRVVKNVAGYDLMKLFAGSFGTLGIVTELTLRAYPLPECSSTVLVEGNIEEISNLTQAMMQSTLTPTAFDILIGVARSAEYITLALRFQSLTQSVAAQVEQVCKVVRPLGLKTEVLADALELEWWFEQSTTVPEHLRTDEILCQVGVLPALAVSSLAILQQKATLQSATLTGRIHAAGGVGQLRLAVAETEGKLLLETLRSVLEQSGGYLSVLEAPLALKQTLDIWGYSGSALNAMRTLKERFDPLKLLNSGRFVGGI